MPVATPKKPAKRRAAAKPAPAGRKTTWLGYARDLIAIRPDVDLTKPTLPAGKHLA